MLISLIRYFFFCKNQNQYKLLGKKYKTTGWNAYRVVHGKYIRNIRDYSIYNEFFRISKMTELNKSDELPKKI